MCGRYASSRRIDDLIEEFEVAESRVELPLEPDYNVAPTKEIYAVVERPQRGEESELAAPRQLRVFQWGLIPSWAKDAAIGSRLINARMETVADKPAFRRAFAARRCLLPADGYYEWYVATALADRPKAPKQPFFIRPRDSGSLAMAGLYEIWRDPARAEDDPHRFRWTATIITTQAEDALGQIHDRMPMMVEPDQWRPWLDPQNSTREDLLGLLTPAAPGRLEAFPVATLVSNVRNNGPELVAPLPMASLPTDDPAGDFSDRLF
jgi:putative SOS response-associated peptidase YedK